MLSSQEGYCLPPQGRDNKNIGMASVREEPGQYGKRIEDESEPVRSLPEGWLGSNEVSPQSAGTFRGLAALDPGHPLGPQHRVKMMEDECE
jgi:hypothetical protein